MKLEYDDLFDVLMDEIYVIRTEGKYSKIAEQWMINGIHRAMSRISELDSKMMEDFTNELL